MKKILAVESDALEAGALASVLAPEYDIVHCSSREKALEYISREGPAAVLLDLPGTGQGDAELMSRIASLESRIPVIAMGRDAAPRNVIAAVRHGATDFLAKPLRLEELRTSLLMATLPPSSDPFIGISEACRQSAETIRAYARYDYPVLIHGESGTGKELAAQAIHDYSGRKDKSFVARNCAAFPDDLIESELFGSTRGAFTGAVERPGAFELADGGTLFLDEIAEAGPGVQAKLLRVLETGDLWRLGDRKPRKVDVRLVSATSRQLDEAVQGKRFRGDLLYRINTLVLELLPLRERREDIGPLALHFAYMAVGTRKTFSAGALELLASHDWPGNVRQLKNTVHRAIVLSGYLGEMTEEHIRF